MRRLEPNPSKAHRADPEARLSELPLLTTAERQQMLVEWNDTQVKSPNEQGVHQLFEAQVEQTPDEIAVIFENVSIDTAPLDSGSCTTKVRSSRING